MNYNKFLKYPLYSFLLIFLSIQNSHAQYKSYELNDKKDTINIIDNKGQKQDLWVIKVPELRGEPGYTEMGHYKNGQREGEWRQYNITEDVIAIENYQFGGKDGISNYFNRFGNLVRQESWRAYNPDAPYDTIPIFGTGGELLEYKVVKAEQYSVKHGDWKFYDPTTGRIIRTERYDHGAPLKDNEDNSDNTTKTKVKVKPKEVLEFEKKHSGRKETKVIDGQVH